MRGVSRDRPAQKIYVRDTVMLRKLFSIAALGLISSATLIASGCTSNGASSNSQQPYGLTGSQQVDDSRNPRYIDSKGHYRSDWASENR